MMEAIDLLIQRRSVVANNMTGPGPSDEELETILQAGLRVPDHGRIFPWRIQILKKDGQAALGDVYAEAFKKDHPEATDEDVEMERQRPQRAPIFLAITAYLNHERAAKVPLMEQKLSGGALCQNVLNAAHALGYVAQWITEWPSYHPDVKKALGHEVGNEIIGLMYIGTATEPPSERKRAEIGDVVSEWSGPAA